MFIPLTIDSEDEYWFKEEQTANKLQEYAILQYISDYTSKKCNKTLRQTLLWSEEGYIPEQVQSAHPYSCLKV